MKFELDGEHVHMTYVYVVADIVDYDWSTHAHYTTKAIEDPDSYFKRVKIDSN